MARPATKQLDAELLPRAEELLASVLGPDNVRAEGDTIHINGSMSFDPATGAWSGDGFTGSGLCSCVSAALGRTLAKSKALLEAAAEAEVEPVEALDVADFEAELQEAETVPVPLPYAGPVLPMSVGCFTHVDPTAPAPGKYFSQAPDGSLVKATRGSIIHSRYETVSIGTLAELQHWMEAASSGTHLTQGISRHPQAAALYAGRVAELEAAGNTVDPMTQLPLITRSNADLSWSAGPGLMVIDSDAVNDMDDVWEALCDAQAGLDAYACLQTTSSSSNVELAGTTTGIRGLHTYLHPLDASDVSRALEALHVRSILAGHARHRISQTGAFLPRSYVDMALKVPSQPVYLKAHVTAPVSQSKAFLHRPGVEVIDTRQVIPDLTEQERTDLAVHLAEARLQMLPQMEKQRSVYLDDRTGEIAQARGITIEAARTLAEAALQGGKLYSDFLIYVDGKPVSVGEILADPTAYHGKACCDPLEPDYAGARTVAMIYSDQARPVIHSFAHSGGDRGSVYELIGLGTVPMPVSVDWAAGQAAEAEGVKQAAQLAAWLNVEPVVDDDAVIGFLGGTQTEGIQYVDPIGLIDDQGQVLQASVNGLLKWMRDVNRAGNAEPMKAWGECLVTYAGVTWDAVPLTLPDVTRVLGIGKKEARPVLKSAIGDWDARRGAIRAALVPQMPVAVDNGLTVEERAAEAARETVRRQNALLGQCRHIAADPLGELDKALTALNVVGERHVANTVFLCVATAVMDKPVNLINRGQSSAGKSYTTEMVTRLFPESFVFELTSMSAKSLIYLPEGSLSHRFIYLEEGEALARQDGEKNDVAEMLRVMISKGFLSHAVVEKNPETGQFETRIITQEGPTGLITTTTRAHLDNEIETRMLSNWLDESSDQSRAIMEAIASVAEGTALGQTDISQWHAFGEWLRTGATRVKVPFAAKLAQALPAHTVRIRRDIRSILDIIKASALVHRLVRDTDAEGNILATLDDYDVAVGCIGQSIGEGHEVMASDNARSLLKAVSAAIDAAAGLPAVGGYVTDPWGTVLEPRKVYHPAQLPPHVQQGHEGLWLTGSVRDMSHLLDVSKSTFNRHAKHCIIEEYLEHPFGNSQGWLITARGRHVVDGLEANIFPDRKDLEE
ncbi:hypothetical protein [Shimia aestuarii]|uniref:Uncharacterized protein n=1 Tax=Shimia aestuarii TaxID=254406 RepID=A0A1I4NMD6_9RHOB|nr:hypothetical protein [Shimia aestuarii]SFM16694.1 hypothetical protein SAMN04488042_104270 [Shimia aestuarii]